MAIKQMETGISNPLFDLRVLLRFDENSRIHVAQCLETGNVVTADSAEEARLMIKELLEDEIHFALKYRNIKNLFSSPAPLDVLVQWVQAANEQQPDSEPLNIDFREAELQEIEPKNTNLTNRVLIAQAA